jgi:hypothetical protein
VSILSRKSPVSDSTSFAEHAKLAARQAVPAVANATTTAAQQAAPLARQAVPMARNAGLSVKQGADGAVAWATPMADAARAWAAPRLEQSAAAISENLAPMISDALITAAHKIDTSPPRQKRHVVRTMLLGSSVLLVAAGAATAIKLRRHDNGDTGYTAADLDAAESSTESVRIIDDETGQDWPDAEANGNPHIT